METLNNRNRSIQFFLILVMGILFFRYFHLQWLKRESYSELATSNKTRYVRIHPGRGLLLSRKGAILAGKRFGYHLDIFLENTDDLNRIIDVVSRMFPHRQEELTRRKKEARISAPYIPFTLLRNLTPNELAVLEARRYDYPELLIQKTLLRNYPLGPRFGHVVGYVGEATLKDLNQDPRLVPGSVVGKNGLEKQYDQRLRGDPGEWLVLVDAREKEISRYLKKRDLAGENLSLTLDARLQSLAFDLMKDSTGSVLLMDINGGILVYLSMPSFSPSAFLTGFSRDAWNKMITHPDNPLLDRNVQGLYPPGSLVKPFIALMAHSADLLDENEHIYCGGGFSFGDHYYRCWNRSGHGRVNLHSSIVESCDTYYYHLAKKVGIDTLAAWLRSCGFGHVTGVDLPTEAAGLVPDETWSREVRGMPWIPGETISVGIGQGPVLVTPLQMATLYAGLANGGRVPRPHLMRDEEPVFRLIKHRPESLVLIRDALRDVVASKDGTAHHLSGEVAIAGKTGTAQLMREVEDKPYLKEHSWFAGYAPVDSPRVAVCVIVEQAGHGSEFAAPIAAEILRAAVRGNS